MHIWNRKKTWFCFFIKLYCWWLLLRIWSEKEDFRSLTKDDILQLYLSNQDWKSSNAGVDDVGCYLYVFGMRYRTNFTVAQPVKIKFNIDEVVLADFNGYALILTNKQLSVTSDEQKYFEIISA